MNMEMLLKQFVRVVIKMEITNGRFVRTVGRKCRRCGMTNEEALELAIRLSCFCNEMGSCDECVFAKSDGINSVPECGIENKMPYEWSIQITKLPNMGGETE